MPLNLTSTIKKISNERSRLLLHVKTLTDVLKSLEAAAGRKLTRRTKSKKARLAISRAQRARWRKWRAAKKAKAGA